LLSRQLLQFAEIQLPQDLELEQVQAYQLSKGQLQQAIVEGRQHIEQLKAQRKALAKHILLNDLPEQDRFQQLRAEKKHFLDTIKLILTGPKRPWPSLLARKCTASMTPAHSFASSSAPKSI
jgi:hypothetical protein